jgi:hypothetical protein
MAFKKIITQNQELNRVQDETARELDRLQFLQFFANGKLLEGVAIGASNTEVTHGLNQEVRGWILVRQDTDARVWGPSTQTPAPKQSFYLRASAACTVSLIIF